MGIYTPQNGITVKKGAVLRPPVYPGVSDDTGLRAGGKTPFSTAFCILPDMFRLDGIRCGFPGFSISVYRYIMEE